MPLINNPLMIAEEYAILDNLTRGRLSSRASCAASGPNIMPWESTRPIRRKRFGEAHDLIVRAWTEPGPFSFVGKHYQLRYVNPWPRPYQSPHPPIWIPSQGSGSTIRWAARMRYTYCQTLSPIAAVTRFFQMYRDEAHNAGYEASPDQLAWSNTIYVAETDEKAVREARPHLEALLNYFLKMPTEMLLPPGYTDAVSMKRVRAAKVTGKPQSVEDVVKNGVVIVGSPRYRAREACGIPGSRRIRHMADQNPDRHAARRHGTRKHDRHRRGNHPAFPHTHAAIRQPRGGGSDHSNC